MKTIIIDLDAIHEPIVSELTGFVNRQGINFRKIEQVTGSKLGSSLVLELATRSENSALKAFLSEQGIASPLVIGNGNKATLDGKKLGKFCHVKETSGLARYWQDKSTGKKFALIQESNA